MKAKALKFLDAAIEYSLYGIIFFIPISIAIIGVFAGIAIVLFLFKKVLSPDFTSIKSNKALFFFLLLFFIFMDLSLLNSGPLIVESIRALLIKWGRSFLLFWIIIDTFCNTKRVNRAVSVLLFSAALIGLSVFSQKFFGWEFLRRRPLIVPFVTGPFKNQNGLSAYLTCVIPVVLSLSLWRWRRFAVKLCLFLVTAMLIISSIWTGSRSGWVGLISGLIFVALFINYHRINKRIRVLFFSGFVFCIPLIALALFFFQGRKDSDRFLLARGAWRMIKENPFLGKGVGTFMEHCSRYINGYGIYYAHNCFLQIWSESGIFSLLSFLLLAGCVLCKSIKASLRIPVSLNLFLLIGLTAGLLGFLVQSFFDVHLYSFQLSFLFWSMLGLTTALNRQASAC